MVPTKNSVVVNKIKRLPPGQRLLRSAALSCLCTCILGSFIPAGVGMHTEEPLVTTTANEPPFQMQEELTELKRLVMAKANQPKLHAGVFVVEPESGRYLNLDANQYYSAASMIKVPVLVKLLTAMDKGLVDPAEDLILRPDLIGGGSGYLQWRPVGSKVSLKEAMESMIIVSDNTATNMIIDRLGGMEACNEDFERWGLYRTYLNDWLPDLAGTNKTSPYDLVQLLAKIDKGELVTAESRSRMLAIMERTRTRTLLPAGIAPGSKISHKTGDIGRLVGDTGIVTTPGGQRYLVAVQVERPHNDRRANELVRDLARLIDEGIKQNKKPAVALSK